MNDLEIEALFIRPPSLTNFFSKAMSADYQEVGLNLLNEKILIPKDELSVEEVFNHLSNEGFSFLFPKILKAYIDKVFLFDGNFASQLNETIWFEEIGLDRKFGRGRRSDMFAHYSASLSPQQFSILNATIELLDNDY